jgi:hypothetical protein
MENTKVVDGREVTILVSTYLGTEGQEMNNGNEIPLKMFVRVGLAGVRLTHASGNS